MPRFLDELKRRKVFKVAAAYLVVGWVVIEVAATVAPQLALPEWAPRFITLLIVLGFPVAMVLAWIFDMTPDGMQVTEGSAGSKRFYATVGVITAAMLGWYFYGTQDADTESASSSADTPPSIAVLAFDNMSPDPENAFFAEGISEEILNILGGVEGLKVASRTSAFSFKGKGTSIPEIARLLDVGHVLEGSVRKQGDRVRITVKLIHAETDAHLWSESYDRELTDIFKVQEEIAQAIIVALRDVLGAREVRVEAPTDDLEAYERFLRGRTNFYRRVNLDEALDDLEFVTGRDPDFAEAWAFLAATRHVVSVSNYPTTRDKEALGELVDEPVARSLVLRPDHTLALAVSGNRLINMTGAAEIEAGFERLRRAAANETNDTTARMWLGLRLLNRGRVDTALPVLENAYRADPMVPINVGSLGYAYFVTGREREGLDLARRAAEMGHGVAALQLLSYEMANRGEFELAGDLYASAMRGIVPEAHRSRLVVSYRRAIVDPESRADHRALRDEIETIVGVRLSGDSIAYGRAGLATMRWPNRVLAAWLPSTEWLRESPEFYRQVDRYGYTRYWADQGYPLDCRLADGPGEPHLECGD